MNIKTFLKRYFHPSVEKSLNTFNDKIIELKERIEIDENQISFSHALISELHLKNQEKYRDIERAENAIAALELITGEHETTT